MAAMNLLMTGRRTSSHLWQPNLSKYVIFFFNIFQSLNVPSNLTFGIPQLFYSF